MTKPARRRQRPRPTAEQPIRVGLITDQGQLDDNGFNELAFRGLKRAEKELGIKGRVVESASAADYIPNMTCWRARRLRPRDRGRLRAGRRDRQGGAEVPG